MRSSGKELEMKKWIAALFAVMLVWNIWLTARLLDNKAQPEETGSDIIDSRVTNYTTELTETVSRWRGSVVSIVSGNSWLSGVIFAADNERALIFTIADEGLAANACTVIFDSGSQAEAEVLGMDAGTGLLLLSVPVSFEVTPFTAGNSTLLKQGEYIIAMSGRRPSAGTGSVSFGVVSEPGQRRVSVLSSWNANIIETDASASQDCYGGPLMNIGGELVGMLTSRPVGAIDRMSYAISVNEMKLVYSEIMENGSVVRGSLGLSGRSVSDMRNYEKNTLGIPLDIVSGVLVEMVYSDSAADDAVKTGDILTAIGEEPVTDLDSLRKILYAHAPGDETEVKLIRDGEEVTERVTLQ